MLNRLFGIDNLQQVQQSLFERKLFQVDESLLSRPEAEQAILKGTLRAKRSALVTATILSWVSWPLLLTVFVVSFTHLWEQVARIVPHNVPPLPIPGELYNYVAAANTGLVDLIAVYLVAVSNISAFAGRREGRAQWFYLLLTLGLNAGFVFRYAPEVNQMVKPYIIWIDLAVAVMLALMVPVSIYAIEKAHRAVAQLRLMLLAEVTTYQALISDDGAEPLLKKLQDEVADLKGSKEVLERLIQTWEARYNELSATLERERDGWKAQCLDWTAELDQAAEERKDLNARLTTALAEVERLKQEAKHRPLLDDPLAVQTLIQTAPLIPVAEPPMTNGYYEPKPRQKGATVMLCEVCGVGELDATEKGIAGRTSWKRKFGGKYACRECRDKAG